MSKATLYLRTFGWAAVGFLVTSGALSALNTSIDAGKYSEGLSALTLSVIAALLAGVLALLQSLKFSQTTAAGKAASQFVQMFIAGWVTLGVADLTSDAAVAFGGGLSKLAIASALGALQAYLVNRTAEVKTSTPAPPPQ